MTTAVERAAAAKAARLKLERETPREVWLDNRVTNAHSRAAWEKWQQLAAIEGAVDDGSETHIGSELSRMPVTIPDDEPSTSEKLGTVHVRRRGRG